MCLSVNLIAVVRIKICKALILVFIQSLFTTLTPTKEM